MTDTVINFTSIPPRMARLDRIIEGLRAQTARIDAIILWVPKTYRRPEFRDYTIPKLPSGIEIRYCEEDYGPATKVLPAVREFAGKDIRLIYCDDDELYMPQWAETLIRGSDEHPQACVTVSGQFVATLDYEVFVRSPRYRLLNMLTLDGFRRYYRNRHRPRPPGIGPVDICQGFGGVLVRPHFFGPEVYDIPDILWTVDDVWLSGHLTSRGIPIRRVSDRKLCGKSELASVHDLTSYSYQQHDRIAVDHMCVEYYRKNYGIWRN